MEARKTLEARIFTRADVDIEVTLESDHNFFVGRSENISEGGIFVATGELRELGSLLSIAMRLPGLTEPIRAIGEVRWVRRANGAPPGMGLQFCELADEDVAALRRFVEERAPMFWE